MLWLGEELEAQMRIILPLSSGNVVTEAQGALRLARTYPWLMQITQEPLLNCMATNACHQFLRCSLLDVGTKPSTPSL